MKIQMYTTTQLAETLNVPTKKIYNTFANHNQGFREGVDFFKPDKDKVDDLKSKGMIPVNSRSDIILWTPTGLKKFHTIFATPRRKKRVTEQQDNHVSLIAAKDELIEAQRDSLQRAQATIDTLQDILKGLREDKQKLIEDKQELRKDKSMLQEDKRLLTKLISKNS